LYTFILNNSVDIIKKKNTLKTIGIYENTAGKDKEDTKAKK